MEQRADGRDTTRRCDTDDDDDASLYARAQQGDEESFTRLYRRHQTTIYRFALHMSGSTAIADDVTQDVFLSVIQGGDQFDARKGTLRGYLLGSARYRVWRHVGRLGREAGMDDSVDEAAEPRGRIDAAPDPLSLMARAETIATIRRAILELPGHHREVVVLCDLQELDYADAASVIGCPVGTVRSRLSRARARLADLLRESGAIDLDVVSFARARCAI